MTARDELEAVIWRQLRCTRQTLQGVTDHRADCRAVDAILQAADAYALAEYGITADRRAELDQLVADTSPAGLIHYQPAGAKRIACGVNGFGLRRSDDAARVDCRKCQFTGLWKQAAA